jgi:hypothetical protein
MRHFSSRTTRKRGSSLRTGAEQAPCGTGVEPWRRIWPWGSWKPIGAAAKSQDLARWGVGAGAAPSRVERAAGRGTVTGRVLRRAPPGRRAGQGALQPASPRRAQRLRDSSELKPRPGALAPLRLGRNSRHVTAAERTNGRDLPRLGPARHRLGADTEDRRHLRRREQIVCARGSSPSLPKVVPPSVVRELWRGHHRIAPSRAVQQTTGDASSTQSLRARRAARSALDGRMATQGREAGRSLLERTRTQLLP